MQAFAVLLTGSSAVVDAALLQRVLKTSGYFRIMDAK